MDLLFSKPLTSYIVHYNQAICDYRGLLL